MPSRILALDLGAHRTGVAFADDSGTPVALDTIEHKNDEELTQAVDALLRERRIDVVVLGLPLLPSGEEGSQCLYVRRLGTRLQESAILVYYLDERYSTSGLQGIDSDASAACQILLTWLERKDSANN